MSTAAIAAMAPERPKGWRRLNAWHACEVRPCGEPGELRWHYWTAECTRESRRSLDPSARTQRPDLSDCLAILRSRNALTVWEPLQTKAPGPPLASAFCCYIQTIVFYHQPYYVWPCKKRFWTQHGLRACTGGFLEWDQIETRIGWNDQLIHRGLVFESAGGCVLWTSPPGERRRWWMRRSLSRSRGPR